MYKVGIEIVVVYQASNVDTGKAIAMDIFDETHAKDTDKSVVTMTEMGTTGRYFATFTPDADGEWVAMMYDSLPPAKGHVVKAFTVGDHSIDSIGDAVNAVGGDVVAAKNEVEDAIAVAESNIRGSDSDSLKTLADQLDAIQSPPMVG